MFLNYPSIFPIYSIFAVVVVTGSTSTVQFEPSTSFNVLSTRRNLPACPSLVFLCCSLHTYIRTYIVHFSSRVLFSCVVFSVVLDTKLPAPPSGGTSYYYYLPVYPFPSFSFPVCCLSASRVCHADLTYCRDCTPDSVRAFGVGFPGLYFISYFIFLYFLSPRRFPPPSELPFF